MNSSQRAPRGAGRRVPRARVINATLAAGLKISRITVDPEGSMTIETDAATPAEPDANEWDKRIKQHADNKKRIA
jgi:hypothetical protein